MSGLQVSGEASDADLLAAIKVERLRVFARFELQWQNAHADEVASVDALVTFNDNGCDTEQFRSLRCPIAGAAHAVILARDNDGGNASVAIAARRFVNRRLSAIRILAREPAFDIGCHQVADAAIRKRAAAHHPVIPASCAVGIEIAGSDTVFLQVFARGARSGDGTSG